jgi:hypothetical protein
MVEILIERAGLFDKIAGARAGVPSGVAHANKLLRGALVLADPGSVLACHWKGETLAALMSEATKTFHCWQGRNRMAIDAIGLDVDGKLAEALVVSRDEAGNVIQKSAQATARSLPGVDAAANPEVGEALAVFREGKLVHVAPVLYRNATAQIIATLETNEVPADYLTCKPAFGWYSLFRPRYGLQTFHGTHGQGQPGCTTLVLDAAAPGAYTLQKHEYKCYTCGKQVKVTARPKGFTGGAAPVDGADTPRPLAHRAGHKRPQAPPPVNLAAITPPVIPLGTLLATWGGTVLTSDVKAKAPFTGMDAAFDSAGRAVAWASTVVVTLREAGESVDGAAVIKKDGGYFVWQVSVSGFWSFSRSNVESMTTLDTSAGKVPGVVLFITSDGYVAPITMSSSPSPATPTYIVDRKRAGAYWHPTRFPSDADFQKARDDVADGHITLNLPETALAFFRGVLRARALKRLDENKALTHAEEARYADTRNAAWGRLREVIKKDREAAAAQSLAESRFTQASIAMGSAYAPGGAGSAFDYGAQFRRAVEAAGSEVAEVKAVRVTLRQEYLALAALDTSKIEDSDANPVVQAMLAAGMADARGAIEEAYRKVHEDDVPVNKLGPIVEEVCADLGITQAKRAAGDMMSKTVLDWLEKQDRTEAIITWVGTIFSVVLGIGAFFASGGTAALLGLAGAATGLGTATYSFDRASSIYTVARGGEMGKPMVTDLEQAHFEYVMGWVNLVLAGLDLGLATRAATPLVKGALAAERMAATKGAEIFAKMKWQDVAAVERAFTLRAAGKAAEADQILANLRKTVDPETVAKAMAVFERPGTVEKLLRELAEDLPAETLAKLKAGIGKDALTDIGRDGVNALVKEHGVDGVLRLKDKLGDALFHGLAAPSGKVPGLAPRLLGELAEKISKDVLTKVGPDALRALAGALQKGEEFEKVIAKLGPALTRRVGLTLGHELLKDLGNKTVLQLMEDLDKTRWTRVVEDFEKLAVKNEEAACKLLAREVEGVQGARAHSLDRHGPEVADPPLARRVTTGIAPDGQGSFTRASTRFKSHKDWLKTRQEAIDGAKSAHGVDVTKPRAQGDPNWVEVVVQHKKPIDEGFVGTGTKTKIQDPTGATTKKGNIFSGTAPVNDLTRTKTGFEWNQAANGGHGQWEMKQHFPLAEEWDQATKTYDPTTPANYTVP